MKGGSGVHGIQVGADVLLQGDDTCDTRQVGGQPLRAGRRPASFYIVVSHIHSFSRQYLIILCIVSSDL